MIKLFRMELDRIQPSQLYISSAKLSQVMKTFDPRSIEPIPVKKLRRYVVFVDGHTRAFAAFQNGLSEVTVYWEYEELDWDAYRICVEWCEKEGIHTIADLQNRIISQQDYDVLWLERCKKMQEDLKAKRKQQVFLNRKAEGEKRSGA